MRSVTMFMRGAALSALLMVSATPALALSKTNLARTAIAEAEGKIAAANRAGVAGEAPHMTAQAEALLRDARAGLARGHKDRAIAEAHRASELADTAIGEAQRARADADTAQRVNAESAAAAAREDAAAANARADAANARANTAEQAAASAANDAAAARAAAEATPPAPAPITTVTTETVKQVATTPRTVTHRRIVRHTTHHPATRTARVTEKTTTTVKTGN